MDDGTVIKLPEQSNGFYFLIIFNLTEAETGIGQGHQKFQQNWELTHDFQINNILHFVFKMWGVMPDNLKIDRDITNHEGKEIAVPATTILGVLNNLASQDPLRFSLVNLQRTQVISKYIRAA